MKGQGESYVVYTDVLDHAARIMPLLRSVNSREFADSAVWTLENGEDITQKMEAVLAARRKSLVAAAWARRLAREHLLQLMCRT